MDNRQPGHRYILLTVDVEDYFQVENFRGLAPFSTWSGFELRIEQNVHRMLDFFDSMPSVHIGATFFFLGWVARKLPGLLREVADRGHEVASHGYFHFLTNKHTGDELKVDLEYTKCFLEDAVGSRVLGYRAPSFSVSNRLLDLLQELNYAYDSSYNSFRLHGRYGHVDLNGHNRLGIAVEINEGFHELPISNFVHGGLTVPMGGGSYFRLFPPSVFRLLVRRFVKENGAYLFYFHPWEIDSGQPRFQQASAFSKFKHYHNIPRVFGRLRHLVHAMDDCRFVSCRDYLKNCDARR